MSFYGKPVHLHHNVNLRMKKIIALVGALICFGGLLNAQEKKAPSKSEISKSRAKKDAQEKFRHLQPPRVDVTKFRSLKERDSLKRLQQKNIPKVDIRKFKAPTRKDTSKKRMK